jgi:hypothetical protein
MNVRFRPISRWPGTTTRADLRKSRYSFKAGWHNTLELLERELGYLGARDVVIEADLTEQEIRLDGWPRADARPASPRIVVSFDSKYGPLRYATDVFEIYQHNVRAIALGLEALRKVDRYGITKRGEQYTGWKALPPGIALGPADFASREEAGRFILETAGENPDWLDGTLDDIELWKSFYRTATKRAHPDAGGDHDTFTRLQTAWQLLSANSQSRNDP